MGIQGTGEMAYFLEAPDSLPSTSVVAYNNL